MHAAAREGIEVNRERGDQRFSFSGFHLRDLALVEDDAPEHLGIEMPQPDRAFGSLPDHGKGFRQKLIERFPLPESLPKFGGFVPQRSVRQRGDRAFVGVDLLDQR